MSSSLNILIKNIEKLETKVSKSEFDISEYFSTDSEILKQILKIKNFNLSKEDINLMVDDVVDNKIPNGISDIKKKELEIKNEMRKKAESLGIYGKGLMDKYKEEINQLKSDIKNSADMLSNGAKTLSKKIANSVIAVSNSIPGIIAMIVAPPWNLPAALTLLSILIDLYLSLIDEIKKIIPFITPLKKLKFVIEKSNIDKVVKILNGFILIILALWEPIDKINGYINEILEFLKNLFKGGDETKKMIRKATRKLRKLDYLPNEKWPTDKESDEYEEIESILETFEVVSPTDKKSALRIKNSEKISKQIDNFISQMEKLPEVSNVIDIPDETLYDVKLPNGTILYKIGEDELDNIKETYEVIYVDRV